jgi:hypothetical protein
VLNNGYTAVNYEALTALVVHRARNDTSNIDGVIVGGCYFHSDGFDSFFLWPLEYVPLRFDDFPLGESTQCFRFIVSIGVPLGVTLLPSLRRANPLESLRVAAVGGLGVAAIAACLLQFFHPFDVTFLDLSVDAVAVMLAVAVSSLSAIWTGRRECAVQLQGRWPYLAPSRWVCT